ncbi:MAG: phospholipid carrier-dependent glycosyltransferase [Planctomycetaceae bacterium]
MRQLVCGPLLIAIATWGLLLLTLDGVGERPALPDGPGLTLDEVFNVEMGIYHWRVLLDEGPLLWTPAGARRAFQQPNYNPDHPPLGRLAIGIAHDVVQAVAPASHVATGPSGRPVGISLYAARVSAATLFALTVWLVGVVTTRWYGAFAGNIAAGSLPLMPRLFGHAHLASLETFVGFACTLTILAAASYLSRRGEVQAPPPPRWRAVLLVGVCLGLALLTKIQAILLPIPIGVWLIWQWRWRGLAMAVLFGLTGVAVFIIGWPWLWDDLVANLLTYLGRSTDRIPLHCYYFGQQWQDKEVPWHYSIFMFLVTVPLGLQFLGGWALWTCWQRHRTTLKTADQPSQKVASHSDGIDPRLVLILANILFPLGFFAVPGITVYDGVRLFLPVFPLWAIFIGLGAATLREILCQRWPNFFVNSQKASWAIVALFLCQGLGSTLTHPCQLSYYNGLIGGPSGAASLGFEATYWRDSITRDLLQEVADKVPEGATIYVAPVLHPANRTDLQLLSPTLSKHRLQLDSYDSNDPAKLPRMQYVLVFRRHADPWASLEPSPRGATLLAEVRRDNVQLAALYQLPPAPQPSR